ncbi:hypothetical protein CW700_02645 [Candidatus Bathyarchaeota archaeon]|nr:MAG: hypothetical protein CW700_02645 [Candidatus Bathyarchaeota archaeon]
MRSLRESLLVLPYLLFPLLLMASCSLRSWPTAWALRLDATVIVLIPLYILWSWRGRLRSSSTLLGGLLAVPTLLLTDALPGIHLSPLRLRLYLCGYHIHHFILASHILALTYIVSKTRLFSRRLKDDLGGLLSPWIGFWLLVWVSQIPEFIAKGINPFFP